MKAVVAANRSFQDLDALARKVAGWRATSQMKPACSAPASSAQTFTGEL
jgi:hypothetical protein